MAEKTVACIEDAIGARRFDTALREAAALDRRVQEAMACGADPEALRFLRQTQIDLSRLLVLARTERAHMGMELQATAGASGYLTRQPSPSTWHVEG